MIPTHIDAARLRSSRIDAPIRQLAGSTMGTGWSLKFAASEAISNADVVAALHEAFDLVILQMSGWEPGSDLCRFNGGAPGWRELPAEFFHVLSRALEVAHLTGGAYNPALGAEMDRLGFGPALANAPQTQATWREIELDAPRRSAFQPGGVALDLSSIAKGFAVDLCAARLEASTIRSFLMEIGGELVGRGARPDGQPWWVELQLSDLPPASDEPLQTRVALAGLAVATSGDFVRRRSQGGRPVSHLLDGRTHAAAAGDLSAVSVVAQTCMDADAWSTALYALGLIDGMFVAREHGLAAVFARRTASGYRAEFSPAAQAMLE